MFLKISQHWSLFLIKIQVFFYIKTYGGCFWLSHWFLFPAPLKTRVKLHKPLELFCKKRVQKFCKFHRKTPVLKSLFTKVVGLNACNFIKARLQHRYFIAKFTKFLRPLIWNLRTNTSEIRSCTWTVLLDNLQNLHFWLKLVHML